MIQFNLWNGVVFYIAVFLWRHRLDFDVLFFWTLYKLTASCPKALSTLLETSSHVKISNFKWSKREDDSTVLDKMGMTRWFLIV